MDPKFRDYECLGKIDIDPVVSPVARVNREDFTKINVSFNTINRNLELPREYRESHELVHRKNQKYVIEVFLVPNGDEEKFLLLDTVEIQNMTLKKLSEIFVNGKYQNPLCNLDYLVGNCQENRVDLSPEELMKIFKFFNDISGKNSKTGLASRNKNETATIMGAEGGSKLDYRYRTEFFNVSKVSSTLLINNITIDI